MKGLRSGCKCRMCPQRRPARYKRSLPLGQCAKQACSIPLLAWLPRPSRMGLLLLTPCPTCRGIGQGGEASRRLPPGRPALPPDLEPTQAARAPGTAAARPPGAPTAAGAAGVPAAPAPPPLAAAPAGGPGGRAAPVPGAPRPPPAVVPQPLAPAAAASLRTAAARRIAAIQVCCAASCAPWLPGCAEQTGTCCWLHGGWCSLSPGAVCAGRTQPIVGLASQHSLVSCACLPSVAHN